VRRTTILLFAGLSACGAHGLEMHAACSNGITITASFEPKVRDFRFWENFDLFGTLPHLRGEIRVVNASGRAQHFSTALAQISGEGVPASRAYLKTAASVLLDGPGVEMPSGESVEYEVYWPVPLEPGAVMRQPRFSCGAG
jgi:hypothetical protein